MNTVRPARLSHIIFATTIFLLAGFEYCLASPFAKQFHYRQPDGTTIVLWGQGDEFSAVFETLDGFAVVFIPEIRAYCYAQLSPDATSLESTGALVGRANPKILGLTQHVRINPASARSAALARYQAWDKEMRLSERWSELKARNLGTRPFPMTPPSFTTTGLKCGLTVLIDFEDEPYSISPDEVRNFLNGDNYTGFGNNGSVKQYFADNSNGRLNFTNAVTAYVTIPNTVHSRSYYNDPTKNCFLIGQELVRDALKVMKALPNFTNDFRPLFDALTVNSQGKVVAANFFVAGGNSGVWSKGIWGQYSALSYSVGQQQLWPGGKIVDVYNLSPMGDALDLYTFSHETGHMLCGFPDLYDYNFDAYGGAGDFCNMCGVASITNPVQFCAYLKIAAGWAAVVDLQPGTNFLASLSASGPAFNRFFRFRKPGVASEYFLLENRQSAGRDAALPGGGIAVWHVDELGNRDNQGLLTNNGHLNYELSLEQADNRWDYQFFNGSRDPDDLFYAGNSSPQYANRFSDLTSPSANWWSGQRSGLVLSDFSTNGPTMTFVAQVQPILVRVDPVDLTVFESQPASFGFAYTAAAESSIQWYKDGKPLTAATGICGIDSNRLDISAASLADAGGYWAALSNSVGSVTTRVARLSVLVGPCLLSTNYRCAGTTSLGPDGIELTSTGVGITGTNDAFRFAFRTLSGDFDVRTLLLGINMKGSATRAGLMVRELTTANSPHLSLLTGLTPEGRPCNLLARLEQGAPTQDQLSFLAPVVTNWQRWQRIQRQGNRFTCYLSEDGSDWTWLKSLELDYNPEVLVGVGLFAGPSQTEAAYAWFRHFEVLTNSPTSIAVFTEQPTAQEGTLGVARFDVYASRNGPLQIPVNYSGSALAGQNYVPPASMVCIPEGTNVAQVEIQALNDGLLSVPKTVEISLISSPGFELVQPARAKALILDDEQTTGGLIRRLYSGIGGWAVTDLTQQTANPNALTEVSSIPTFETPTNSMNYGQVLSGYLVPPETGDYIFYLASDENSELWLSTDSDPVNIRKIAGVVGYTAFRDFLGAGNHSDPIFLEQGKYYYLKALHKQGWGADCFSVAWQLPGGVVPTNGSEPIAGDFLAFSAPSTNDLILTPPSARFRAVARTGSVAVITQGSWSAESLEPWIVLSGDTTGTGAGRVAYQIAPNTTGLLRAGNIVIKGHTHSVIQAVPPALKISFNQAQVVELKFDTDDAVVLEACSDLETWQPIWTNSVPGTLSLKLIDPATQTAPVRFYRAVQR